MLLLNNSGYLANADEDFRLSGQGLILRNTSAGLRSAASIRFQSANGNNPNNDVANLYPAGSGSGRTIRLALQNGFQEFSIIGGDVFMQRALEVTQGLVVGGNVIVGGQYVKLPDLHTSQMDAIQNPVRGMLIHNYTAQRLAFYTGDTSLGRNGWLHVQAASDRF